MAGFVLNAAVSEKKLCVPKKAFKRVPKSPYNKATAYKHQRSTKLSYTYTENYG
jgi:hypothetical protein